MSSIMVIDDNDSNLKLTGDLLEYEGFRVARCEDAVAALETLQEFRPDLILMDLALPGMSGVQLTRKLKASEETQAIPIVALTASVMKGDKEKTLNSGFDGYIPKPIDTRTFKDQVMRYLKKDG